MTIIECYELVWRRWNADNIKPQAKNDQRENQADGEARRESGQHTRSNGAQSSGGTSHKGDGRRTHLTMRITTCIIHPVGWRKECMYIRDDDWPIDLVCEPSVCSSS